MAWVPFGVRRYWPTPAPSAREATHMDLVSRLQRDLPPLPRWMGITITVAEPDRVVAEITVRGTVYIRRHHAWRRDHGVRRHGRRAWDSREPARRAGDHDGGEQDEFLRRVVGR